MSLWRLLQDSNDAKDDFTNSPQATVDKWDRRIRDAIMTMSRFLLGERKVGKIRTYNPISNLAIDEARVAVRLNPSLELQHLVNKEVHSERYRRFARYAEELSSLLASEMFKSISSTIKCRRK